MNVLYRVLLIHHFALAIRYELDSMEPANVLDRLVQTRPLYQPVLDDLVAGNIFTSIKTDGVIIKEVETLSTFVGYLGIPNTCSSYGHENNDSSYKLMYFLYVLNDNLKQYYHFVEVELSECPDLRQPPYNFPTRGICGSPRVLEVGGPPYLLPTVNRDKVYNFHEIYKILNFHPVHIIGAGAGPFPYAGTNCEGIYNLLISDEFVSQASKIAKISNNGTVVQEDLPKNETRFALLANLYASQGKGGEVIKVHVKQRKNCPDFIRSIRNCLIDGFPGQQIGMGGLFFMKHGVFKHHVMPDFPKGELKSEEELNMWLNFYNMSAPMVAVGTFFTKDTDLDLRLQHFHSYSDHNEAGHYHHDVTPDTVEYVGYFNVAESVLRVDAPGITHQMGRD